MADDPGTRPHVGDDATSGASTSTGPHSVPTTSEDDSSGTPTPPATATSPPTASEVQPTDVLTARASSIPPSTSAGSIFRSSHQHQQQQQPAAVAAALGKGLQPSSATGSQTRSSSFRPQFNSSPPGSPTHLRASSRALPASQLTTHRTASVRMPSNARGPTNQTGGGTLDSNQTETESVVSADGEYFDDDAAMFSEMEALGDEALGHQQRGRSKAAPSSVKRQAEPSVSSAARSGGSKKAAGEGGLKGKGKAPGRRPPISRSRSRAARRDSESDSDEGTADPAPLLGGAAAMGVSGTGAGAGSIEDDEVERVDRGEELVRRRMKERQRAKKEAEKARRAEEGRSRQTAKPPPLAMQQQGQSPAAAGTGRTAAPQSAGSNIRFQHRASNLPSPQMSMTGARPVAPSEAGISSAGASWERAPADWSQRTSTRASQAYHERRPSGTGSLLDSVGGEDRGSVEADDERTRGRDASFLSYAGADVSGPGGQTPTAQGRVPRSDSIGDVPPKSPALGAGRRFASRGLRAVSYASTAPTKEGIPAPVEEEPTSLVEEPQEGEHDTSTISRREDVRDDDETGDEERDGEHRDLTEGEDVDSSSEGDGGDDVEYTLKDRQDAINIEHPFGLPIWKPALYKKSRSATRNAEAALHNVPKATTESNLKLDNLVWTFFFGFWLALLFALLSGLLFVIPWGGSKYGRVVWELATYLFWPFGKYVEAWSEDDDEDDGADDTAVERDDRTDADGNGDPSPYAQRWEAFSDIGDDDVEAGGRTWGRQAMRLAGSYGTATDDGEQRYGAHGGNERSGLLSPSRTESGTIRQARSDRGTEAETKDRNPSGSSTLSGNTAMPGRSPSRSGGKAASSVEGYVDGVHRHDGKPPIRVRALGRLSYWAAYYLAIAPLMLIACLACWFFVFTIPMAKLLWVLVRHLGSEPLALHFREPPTFVPVTQNGEAQESADGGIAPRLKPGQPAPKHSKKSLSNSRAKGRLVSGKAKVLLCTYQALGLQYYKYTVDGVNIIFIILMPFVIFVILDALVLEPLHLGGFGGFLASQGVIFVMALLSVIPLSYFIGMAVASISAQSSIGMGAVINATFGSIIEILLYSIALTKGKGELVEGSIIGSMLAGVLLMPGLSMIGGAVRRKEQKFNARSAGVTSTMLIMAIIGTLTPTLFYEIYGTFQLSCTDCPADGQPDALRCRSCRYEHVDPADDPFYLESVRSLSFYCAILLVFSYIIGLWFSLRTHASQIWQTPANLAEAPAPHAQLQPGDHQRLSAYVKKLPELLKQHRASATAPDSAARPGSTVYPSTPAREGSIGAEELRRTLRVLEIVSQQHQTQPPQSHSLRRQQSQTSNVGTYHARDGSRATPGPHHGHAHGHAVAEGADHGGGHEAPTWSRLKSTTVLLTCTVLYAIIAEILVEVVDVVLNGSSHIPEKLLGITLFALVPNTTEFMNAISFAINGNIALSMEIGSAYTLQVCLIQIPIMILFSAIYNAGQTSSAHHAFTLVFPRWDIISIIFAVFLLTYTYIEARANYYRGTILVLSYLVLIGGFFSAPSGLDTSDDPILFSLDASHPIDLSFGQSVSTWVHSLWR